MDKIDTQGMSGPADPNYDPTEVNPNFNDERYRGSRNTITM